MIRTLQKNNETLQIGTLRDRRTMGSSSASFRDYDAAVSCLRRFIDEPYNMLLLRRVLRENSCQGTIQACNDQDVVSQVARKVARGELLLTRQRTVHYGSGSSTPAVKEVPPPEPKRWDKTEYVKQFLKEHELEPVLVSAQADKTSVVIDASIEVVLKRKRGSTIMTFGHLS